ncbi:MAG: Hsp20/alpha crystallin family protein [Deltaproteobacteria bacterium]|nr:Hsp20/alpha crystallin family protein [Deltaproteobacteria bacterium]
MFDLIPFRKRTLFPTMWGRTDDVFERFFEDFPVLRGGVDLSSDAFLPSVDVSETEKDVVVRVEAPGMEAKNFDLSLKDNVLCISGEKKEETEKTEGRYHTRESRYGSFRRNVCMPGEVDETNVDAAYEGGVLKVTLHKTEEAKEHVKKIEVH